MAEKKIRFDIEANSDAAQRAVAALRREFDNTLNALKRQQGDIAVFKSAQRDAANLERQIKALGRAGGDTTALNAALAAQRARLVELSGALQKAGIDTNALNAAQSRLRGQIDQTQRTFRSQTQSLRTDLDGLQARTAGVGGAITGLFSRLAVQLGAVLSLGKLGGIADEYNNLQARLKLASRNTEEFNAANEDVVSIATRARVPLSQTAELYTRIAASVKDLPVAQKDISGVTEAVALSLRISGASAAESSSAMLQFSQAIASGVLRGEEFNAINEAAPRLLQGLAKSLGVQTGQLRAMAKEGELTRDVLINGLLQALPQLREEAVSLPSTIGSAFTELRNQLTIVVGQFDQATGFSRGFADTVNAIGTKGLEAVSVLAANLAFVFKSIGREIGGIAAQVVALARGDFKAVGFIGEEMKRDAEEARKALDKFEKQVLSGEGRIAKAMGDTSKAAADRNVAQKALSEKFAQIKESETVRIKAALEEQTKAHRKAESELKKIENDRVALAEDSAKRIAALKAGPQKEKNEKLTSKDDSVRFFAQAEARSDLLNTKRDQKAAFDSGNLDAALTLGKQAQDQIDQLAEAGADAISTLVYHEKQVADIMDKALAGKAEIAKAESEKAALAIESLKKELEGFKNIKVGVDVASAEKAVRDMQKRMQEILDGKPLLQSVKLGPDTASLPARAHGGPIRGPGSATSDSILARLSDGEYVVRAAAVKKLGLARLHAINQGRIPAFADGGLIARSVAGLPQISGRGGDGGARNILNLTVPELGTFETRVTDAVAAQIQRTFRTAALQHGRRK